MTRLVILSAIGALLLALPAQLLAQEEQEELDFRTRMQSRMLKSRLKLTDEQTSKLNEILKNQQKETASKIKELLNDEQKAEYDKMQSESSRFSGFGNRSGRSDRGDRGDRGGPGAFGGRGGPGGMMRMGGLGNIGQLLDQMKKRLNLTDGQADKVEEILNEITAEISEKVMEKLPDYMGEGGRPDFRKMIQDFSKDIEGYLDKAEKKIRKVLKEEQIPEFEKMMSEFREQIKSMTGMMGGRGDRGRSERFGRGNRIDRIMDDLEGSPEEKAILKEKIEAILKAQEKEQSEVRRIRGELDRMINAGEASLEAMQDKLNELRKMHGQVADELKTLREDLVPLLTFQQEAKLVIHRVLE